MRHRINAVELLILSAWCGLASGLLEVAARVICRAIDPTQRLFMLSRHFLWLGPLSSLLFFLTLGAVLSAAVVTSPRVMGWLGPRLICACAALPVLMALGRRYIRKPGEWSRGNRRPGRADSGRRITILSRKMLRSLPLMAASVFLLASYVFAADRIKQSRESSHPLPPAGSPNVLMVVLDTVRADRLSLYGYERPTTPFLKQLAQRGVRFDEARATAPWTLPSHASMFNGRWPRVWRQMGQPAREGIPNAGRVPGKPWLCDRGLCRQRGILFPGNRACARIHVL